MFKVEYNITRPIFTAVTELGENNRCEAETWEKKKALAEQTEIKFG